MVVQEEFEIFMQAVYPDTKKGSLAWTNAELIWHSSSLWTSTVIVNEEPVVAQVLADESREYCRSALKLMMESNEKRERNELN